MTVSSAVNDRSSKRDRQPPRDRPAGRSGPGRDGAPRHAGATLAAFRQVIGRIPRGRVVTYGRVARAVGRPGAARLTVRALRSGTGLPWHRVVAAGGRIALPGEEGREQRLRLELEGVRFRGAKVRMDLHEWIPRAGILDARPESVGPADEPRELARRSSGRIRAERAGPADPSG